VCTAAALLLTACGAGQGASAEGDPGAGPALAALPGEVPEELTRYYEQKPSWRDCG
jgi:hypothetical protein